MQHSRREVAVPVNQQVAPIQMANQPVDVGNEIAAQTGGDIASTTPNDPASVPGKLVKFFMKVGVTIRHSLIRKKVICYQMNLVSWQFSMYLMGSLKKLKEPSDVDFISKGEQIYYEGKVYQQPLMLEQ